MNFESRNPATGELLATYPEHDKVETKHALAARLGRLAALVPHSTAGANRLPHSARRAAVEERAETYGRPNHREWASRWRTSIFEIKKSLGPPATSPKRGGLSQATARRRRTGADKSMTR